MTLYYESELYHHGVKGMKWGVRKDKQRYGMSKREVKQAIRKAKRNYRKNENPYHTFDGTTGKNWAKIRSENRKAVNDDEFIKNYNDKRDSAYKQAELHDSIKDQYSSGGTRPNQSLYDYHLAESQKHQIKGDTYSQLAMERTAKIGQRYTQKYNDALLKDIGYKGDIETGRAMLEKYKIVNSRGRRV